MKRHLVFSFYIFRGWEKNFANMVHIAWLEHYHDLYDDAKFIIICDDTEDTELISSLERRIVEIGYTNVEFKVVKNTLFREAKPFYDELATKLDEYDGLVTWGHNKGVSSLYFDHQWLFNWLSMLYYGTMGLMGESERVFISNYYGGEKYFFGVPLVEGNGKDIMPLYGGTFFNMNPGSIVRAIGLEGKKIPVLSNRAYAEQFPGTLFGKERLGSYENSYLYNKYGDMYSYDDKDWDDTLKIVFGDMFGNFEKEKNRIWTEQKFSI